MTKEQVFKMIRNGADPRELGRRGGLKAARLRRQAKRRGPLLPWTPALGAGS